MKQARIAGVLLAALLVGPLFGHLGAFDGRGGSAVADAQTAAGVGYKEVRCGPQTRMDAVIVTKVTVAGQEVQCGLTLGPDDTQTVTPFQAGDDWLTQTDIYLLNRTDRTIVRIDVPLGFPDTGNGHTEPQSIYSLTLGRIPAVAAYSHRTGKPIHIDSHFKPAAFTPGQTLVLHVGDYIEGIRGYVEQQMPLSQATKIDIHRGTFYFDDGMRWQAGGGFSIPDPARPGWFKQMDMGRFFPGHPSQNWPPPRRP